VGGLEERMNKSGSSKNLPTSSQGHNCVSVVWAAPQMMMNVTTLMYMHEKERGVAKSETYSR